MHSLLKMELSFKVLTLNCWGLALISSDRKKRFLSIAGELASGEYDFVVLQEVWCKSDYETIVNHTQDVLPHSYYFYSGVIGSGLCVFCKVPIVDVHFFPFPLNGYPHKLRHGDWFSGKGVGMCRVNYEGFSINIFTAHLHAEYNRDCDEYLHHRLCQAFDFSQFVKYNGRTAHLNIVAGDFNAEPTDLPFKIICFNGQLKDAFIEQEQGTVGLGSTDCHPRNSYTPKSAKSQIDPGKRIDYILYSTTQGVDLRVLSCTTPLDKCPNETFSFSDHEAVVATFLVTKSQKVISKAVEQQINYRAALMQARGILDEILRQLIKDKIFYFIMFALFFCLIFGSIGLDDFPYVIPSVMMVIRAFLTIVMLFCLWMGSIENSMERNSILATNKAISVLIQNVEE